MGRIEQGGGEIALTPEGLRAHTEAHPVRAAEQRRGRLRAPRFAAIRQQATPLKPDSHVLSRTQAELAPYTNDHLAVEIQRVQEHFVDAYGILIVPLGGSVIRQLQQNTHLTVNQKERTIDFTNVANIREKREDGTTVDIDAIALSAHRDTATGTVILDSYDEVMSANRSRDYLTRVANAKRDLLERQKTQGGPPWSVEAVEYQERPETSALERSWQVARYVGKELKPRVPQFVSKIKIFPPEHVARGVHTIESHHESPLGRMVFSMGPVQHEVAPQSLALYQWQMHLQNGETPSFLTFSPVGVRERFLGVRVPHIKGKDVQRIAEGSPIYAAAEAFKEQTHMNEAQYQALYGPWHNFSKGMQTSHAPLLSIKRALLDLYWDKVKIKGETIGEFIAHRVRGDSFAAVR